jgi:hypothetical protein
MINDTIRNKYYIFFFLILIITECSLSDNQVINGIEIDLNEPINENFDGIFSNVELIKLETKKESLIGRIHQWYYRNNRLSYYSRKKCLAYSDTEYKWALVDTTNGSSFCQAHV